MKGLICTALMAFTLSANALTVKVGVLAPDGTPWAKNMKQLAKEVRAKTNKKVRLKFYFGGSQGDEVDVLRKIRVGQLHGGFFTGKTLGDIAGDIRVMEIPFTFNGDREKAWNTLSKLAPYFNQKLDKAEFQNLGFIEIGMVYFVSQKKTANLDSMKGLKIWQWEGDEIVSTMIGSLNLVSVPLALPDVLGSLSTGVIQAAYAPPMGMVALQWHNKVKYLVDFPIAYSTGAFLVGNKTWAKISPEHQKIVKDLSAKYIEKVRLANINDNVEALKAVKASGVEFIKFSDADVKKAKATRKQIVSKLKGKLFSNEALKKLEGAM